MKSSSRKIHMDIEVFDCFGESFECSICQEPIEEGQRTLVVERCQHGFHEQCIEPWRQQNNSCPNCRTPISSPSEAAAEATAEQTNRELEKLYVSYILVDWILRQYRGHNTEFRRDYRILREAFHTGEWTQGTIPIPMDRLTLSNLTIVKQYIIRREREINQNQNQNQQYHPIHRSQRLLAIRETALPRLIQFVQQRQRQRHSS